MIRFWTVSVALLCLSGRVAAQDNATIEGRVLEFTTDAPVAAVQVELLDSRQRRVGGSITDDAGAFRFTNVRPGSYQLRARSIGYREVTTPAVDITAGDPVSLIVRIAVDAVPLAPLEVVTRPSQLHHNVALAGFLERSMRRMGGAFIRLEEIEERQPRQVTDLIRTASSMIVIDHARGGVVLNNRTQCAPSVWIDGRWRTGGVSGSKGEVVFNEINSMHWSEVEGIEVYSGAATVPAQFAGSRAACGVIAIWTRR